MALTLAEADRYSTNMVYRGVVEEFYRASPIFPRLGFIDVHGNAYQYIRESVRSTAAFYDPQDVWTENTATTAQVTVALRILGGDADIDEFLRATRSDQTDIESELIAEKAKQVKFRFLDAFYYGANATSAREFDGCQTLITTGQTIRRTTTATGDALRISDLDATIDLVVGRVPDIIVTTKAIRRRLNAYVRANGLYEENRDQWGNMISTYQGIPLYVDDSLLMTETDSATGYYSSNTGGSNGSVFALSFAPDALFGLQNSGSISVKKIREELETKDAARWRIKWYVSMGLGSTVSCARYNGVTDVAATA